MLGDKGKPLLTGDTGTRTDERGPKPRILTDIQTGKKGTHTNKLICVRRPKPRRLVYVQTGKGRRARVRTNLYVHGRDRSMHWPHNT